MMAPPRRARSVVAAGRLRLPVFVVLSEGTRRRVRRGWVATWDDDDELFLIEFSPTPVLVTPGDRVDAEPFEVFEQVPRGRVWVRTRPNQQRFRMQVLQRYGAQCAVCDVNVLELITAAHLVPDEANGTSDPRNGLPLCANHHVALDRGLIRIDPATTNLVLGGSLSPTQLGVTRRDLSHLPVQPAPEALDYRWRQSVV